VKQFFLPVYYLNNKFRKGTMSNAVMAGNRLIEARRKSENAYKEMEVACNQERKITLSANFENTTFSKIERKTKQVRRSLMIINLMNLSVILFL
jgi:hypothetical protein